LYIPLLTFKAREVLMPTVSYETEEGTFHFDQEEAVEALQSMDSPDEIDLIRFLESQTGDTVEIPQEKDSFSYAVLKLLDDGKGSVRCKICGKEYQSRALRSFSLGAEESPFKVKGRWKRSLLERVFRGTDRLPLFGGKGNKCRRGHTLISAVTWRT
jgi:hypothetical protein